MTLLPISRTVASRLVTDASRPCDASVMALTLSVLSRVATRVYEVCEGRDWTEWLDRRHDPYEAAFDPVFADWADLQRDTGLRPSAALAAAKRATCAHVSIAGERSFAWTQPVAGIVPITGSDITPTTKVVRVGVDRALFAVAEIAADTRDDDDVPPDPLLYDADVVRAATNRWTALCYLRTLAWHDDPARLPAPWKARRESDVLVVEIPPADIGNALGVEGMRRPADVERMILAPVRRDLAAAGLRWEGRYKRGPSGKAGVLVIRSDVAAKPTRTAAKASERTAAAASSPARRSPPGGLAGLRVELARAAQRDRAARAARTAGPQPKGWSERQERAPRPPRPPRVPRADGGTGRRVSPRRDPAGPQA